MEGTIRRRERGDATSATMPDNQASPLLPNSTSAPTSASSSAPVSSRTSNSGSNPGSSSSSSSPHSPSHAHTPHTHRLGAFLRMKIRQPLLVVLTFVCFTTVFVLCNPYFYGDQRAHAAAAAATARGARNTTHSQAQSRPKMHMFAHAQRGGAAVANDSMFAASKGATGRNRNVAGDAEAPVKYFTVCDDLSSMCEEGKCCLMNAQSEHGTRHDKSKLNFGCCPYTHGKCCPELGRCCPSGYTCADADTIGTLEKYFGRSLVTHLHCFLDHEELREAYKHFSLWAYVKRMFTFSPKGMQGRLI